MLLAIAPVACSSTSSGGATPARDSGTPATDATGMGSADAEGDAGADAGQDSAPNCSQGCPPSSAMDTICVDTVQASVIDTKGAPIAGQDLLVCGDNLCSLPGKTDAMGHTTFSLCEGMVLPALKFLGGTAFVSFASEVTMENTTFPPITLFPLPATGGAIPAGAGKVTSGSVTLAVAAGAVMFDPTQATDADTQAFRAAQVDVAKVPAALPASLALKAIWGLGPVNATIDPPGTLTIPNSEGWAAGAKVDFYMNGVEPTAGVLVPYGKWGSVGTGTVSMDGKTVSTDTGSGNGIPVLSMVGARLHM